jgi:hypothetical protein
MPDGILRSVRDGSVDSVGTAGCEDAAQEFDAR